MVSDIIESEAYKNLTTKQIKETIEFLLDQGVEFAITVNIKGATFNPELPESILSKLSNFSLFVLANYTYSTVKLNENELSFEAGFGAENFGSTVTIPLYSIFQVVMDESILFVNPVATVEKFNNRRSQFNKSLNAFKNNPNNKKFED